MRCLSFLVGIIFLSNLAFGQNLLEERIIKIADKKRAIYLGQGVFHHPTGSTQAMLSGLRSSYVKSRGYERIVIDFKGNQIPKIYGHISSEEKRISVDFFDATINPQVNSLKNTKFVKSVDFLSVDPGQVTMEIQLKDRLNFDIFYLENPGRLVIDIRR